MFTVFRTPVSYCIGALLCAPLAVGGWVLAWYFYDTLPMVAVIMALAGVMVAAHGTAMLLNMTRHIVIDETVRINPWLGRRQSFPRDSVDEIFLIKMWRLDRIVVHKLIFRHEGRQVASASVYGPMPTHVANDVPLIPFYAPMGARSVARRYPGSVRAYEFVEEALMVVLFVSQVVVLILQMMAVAGA